MDHENLENRVSKLEGEIKNKLEGWQLFFWVVGFLIGIRIVEYISSLF